MEVRSAALSDQGRRREKNQDAYLSDHPIYVVADGMGGHRAGEVASELTIEILRSAKDRLATGQSDALKQIVLEADRSVFEHGRDDPTLEGMGTTVTAAYLQDDTLMLAHVGDSRAYLLRGDKLSRLTEDQTLVAQWEKEGKLEPGEAERHPQRNILTQAVGSGSGIEVDLTAVELHAGDRILLASDGLHGMLDDDRIRDILVGHDDPDEACRALVDAANTAGGDDNITVLIIDAAREGAGGARAGGAETAPVIVSKPSAGGEPGRFSGRRLGRRAVLIGAGVGLLVLVGALVFLFRPGPEYFVGTAGGNLAILRGDPGDGTGGRDAEVVRMFRDEPLTNFPRTVQRDLREGIRVGSLQEAERVVATLPRTLGPQDTPRPSPVPAASAPAGGTPAATIPAP